MLSFAEVPRCVRRGATLALAGFCLALAPAGAGAAADYSELPMSVQPSDGVTMASDGNLYLVLSKDNSIGRLTPGGGLTRFAGRAAHASYITEVGNSLYYPTGSSLRKLSFDGEVLNDYPLGFAGYAVAAEGQSAIWVTSFPHNPGEPGFATTGIRRVDLGTGTVRSFPFQGTYRSIAYTADAAWVVDVSTKQVRRIKPINATDAEVVNYTPALAAGETPYDIVVGADGKLWVSLLSGRVARLDPATGVFSYFPVHGHAVRLARGSDTGLWYTGGQQIGRLDVNGVSTGTVPTTSATANIAAGAGAVWATMPGANRVLWKRTAIVGAPQETPTPAPGPETCPNGTRLGATPFNVRTGCFTPVSNGGQVVAYTTSDPLAVVNGIRFSRSGSTGTLRIAAPATPGGTDCAGGCTISASNGSYVMGLDDIKSHLKTLTGSRRLTYTASGGMADDTVEVGSEVFRLPLIGGFSIAPTPTGGSTTTLGVLFPQPKDPTWAKYFNGVLTATNFSLKVTVTTDATGAISGASGELNKGIKGGETINLGAWGPFRFPSAQLTYARDKQMWKGEALLQLPIPSAPSLRLLAEVKQGRLTKFETDGNNLNIPLWPGVINLQQAGFGFYLPDPNTRATPRGVRLNCSDPEAPPPPNCVQNNNVPAGQGKPPAKCSPTTQRNAGFGFNGSGTVALGPFSGLDAMTIAGRFGAQVNTAQAINTTCIGAVPLTLTLGGTVKLLGSLTAASGDATVYLLKKNPYVHTKLALAQFQKGIGFGGYELPCMQFTVNPLTISGDFRGSAWNLTGYTGATISLPKILSTGNALDLTKCATYPVGRVNSVVSEKGWALCGGFDLKVPAPSFTNPRRTKRVRYHAALGQKWKDVTANTSLLSRFSFWVPGSCDLGEYRTPVPAGRRTARAAAALGVPVFVERGSAFTVIRARGYGDAPDVTVTGPGAFRYDTADRSGKNSAAFVVSDPEQATTFMQIAKPRPGMYTVTPSDESSRLRQLSVANGQLPPKVDVTVTGKGSVRTLQWRARPRRNQRLTFLLRSAGGLERLVSTGRTAGKHRFPDARGVLGRRSIIAEVRDAGVLRQRHVVASFAGPSKIRVSRPRNLRGAREGRLLRLRWKPTGLHTDHYEVVAQFGPTRLLYLPRRPRVTVGPIPRGSRVTVRVRGVTVAGARGPVKVFRRR